MSTLKARAEALRTDIVIRAFCAGISIPKWVPTRLIVEFADCALAHGEEQAAHYIRRRKREAVHV